MSSGLFALRNYLLRGRIVSMDSLNEEIDELLNKSLLEIDISDLTGGDTTKDAQEKESEKLLANLEPRLAKELTGLFRLVAIAITVDPTRAGRYVYELMTSDELYPDFLIKVPDVQEVIEALRAAEHYNAPGRPDKYSLGILLDRSGRARPRAAVSVGNAVAAYETVMENVIDWVKGKQTIELEDGTDFSIDFKERVVTNWTNVESILEEFMTDQTDNLSGVLDRMLDAPTGALGTARIDEVEGLPSEIAKQDTNLHGKILNFLQKEGTAVDKNVNELTQFHYEKIVEYMKEYQINNSQETGDYGYAGPRADEFSKAVWEKFINEFINPLIAEVNTMNNNLKQHIREIYGASTPAPLRRRTRALMPLEEAVVNEDKLATIVIDLDELKKQELNESFLAMFGGWIEQILGSMFGGRSLPLAVKGSRRDVESFAKTIAGEKSYLETARKYGLDHPTTYKNRAKLQNSIKGFERETGLKWPFK